ncbi:MAG: DsbA family protein [Gemmatimonadetes bacterium]|nr:DsbA family protein [Gemmatimonadota bacterium]
MPQSRRATPQKSSYRSFYWILGAIAVVGIGVLLFAVLRARAGRAATEPVPMQALTSQELFQKARPVTLGESSAPVRMVVFSDYMCPFCGQWAAQVQPALVNDFVKSGKLQILYYDFPLGGAHRWSFLAARAARCAEAQGKFWEYHDLLFGRQSEWSASTSEPVGLFETYAGTVGLDPAKFNACLESDQYAELVTANRQLGEQLGVDATPTIIINQEKVQNPLDYGVLRDLIAKEAGAAPAAGTAPAAPSGGSGS